MKVSTRNEQRPNDGRQIRSQMKNIYGCLVYSIVNGHVVRLNVMLSPSKSFLVSRLALSRSIIEQM